MSEMSTTKAMAQRAHALLAPSSAKRWLSCPASARLEDSEPSRETAYTKEGTIAHAFAADCLEWLMKTGSQMVEAEAPAALAEATRHNCEQAGLTEAADEIVRVVWDNYVRLIWEDFLGAKRADRDAEIFVEKAFRLDRFVPESFGSADAVIAFGDMLKVYDLKYGKGVRVSAKGNPQMRLYALGAYFSVCELYDTTRVEATIIQPRLGAISTEALCADDLMNWANNELKPKAELAFSGDGPAHPGEHCKFCRVAHKCEALAAFCCDSSQKPADTLTDEQMAQILAKIPVIEGFVEAVKTRTLEAALNGTKFPGYKLVEGRSVRKIGDTAAAVERLSQKFEPSSYLKPQELKTITELEKVFTKKGFAELLGDLVIKPAGKPVLVPDSDPRQELNSATNEYNDIINQ